MFKVEKNNEKIGAYLAWLIDQQFPSRREFCRQYIKAGGETVNEENTASMANRLSQIIKGKKAIQLYDLPYFTQLLGVSCEQLLSAGEYSVPPTSRVTNYAIASSKDPAVWESYIQRADKLVLNYDEYGKTVIDYALDFGNYEFLKYLMEKNYIWFDSGDDTDYTITFGAGTSIHRRHIGYTDTALDIELKTKDSLRKKLIALAADSKDCSMLEELRARELPQLHRLIHYWSGTLIDFEKDYDEKMVRHIAASSEKVLDYFTDSFEVRDHIKHKDGSHRTHTFMFPYISQLLDMLIAAKSPFAETAMKKALQYNKATYQKLCKLIQLVRSNPHYDTAWGRNLLLQACRDEMRFSENGNIIAFRAVVGHQSDGIVTNVPRVKRMPSTPSLKHLAEELNTSYDAIRNITEHLEEIVK